MASKILLNDITIPVEAYNEELTRGLRIISVVFNVTSENYHAITSLLYKQTFDVKIPEKNLAFRGTIRKYATSITNLYHPGQVGEFHLVLRETPEQKEGDPSEIKHHGSIAYFFGANAARRIGCIRKTGSSRREIWLHAILDCGTS
ncbi:DUF3219 family protein [Virgibacillus sp. 179-BFC.A HS]|uniref:DUF3219 family protein n=1 Tax=Tigheibacillus jepli TaxID=3035914 RepID=A0ABU5CJG2_9BACI|nr:DUF3219 family protein [Virgibacillus sp. 179-BFC.A HS]MDY0406441.1 DUF3219 family protein [Virgibacillus sp. 179-BFC.A HS]